MIQRLVRNHHKQMGIAKLIWKTNSDVNGANTQKGWWDSLINKTLFFFAHVLNDLNNQNDLHTAIFFFEIAYSKVLLCKDLAKQRRCRKNSLLSLVRAFCRFG